MYSTKQKALFYTKKVHNFHSSLKHIQGEGFVGSA